MKKLFTFIIVVLQSLIASADPVEIDSIYYNLIKGGFAEVTSNPNKYTGYVNIPEMVNHEGKEYTVVSIGSNAFSVCSGMTAISIPNSVTRIGSGAFLD